MKSSLHGAPKIWDRWKALLVRWRKYVVDHNPHLINLCFLWIVFNWDIWISLSWIIFLRTAICAMHYRQLIMTCKCANLSKKPQLNPDHLKSDFQKVWISYVSRFQMVGFQIHTSRNYFMQNVQNYRQIVK